MQQASAEFSFHNQFSYLDYQDLQRTGIFDTAAGFGQFGRFMARVGRAVADTRTWSGVVVVQMARVGVSSLPIALFIALLLAILAPASAAIEEALSKLPEMAGDGGDAQRQTEHERGDVREDPGRHHRRG